MIRRRRRVREIPFSFDSFLDIVANVVGIIIRLILVVWVGARSYSSVQSILKSREGPSSPATQVAAPVDPLRAELEERRRELTLFQKALLVQLRQLQEAQLCEGRAQQELADLAVQQAGLDREEKKLTQILTGYAEQSERAALSLADMRQRCQKLAEEIRRLQEEPIPKRALHYRTPVSQPVHSEELLFECWRGRVTFIDIAALLTDVKNGMEEKGKQLRTRWQVEDVTPPAGAFRLHYVIERDRELLDALGGDAGPASTGNYRYGLSEWRVEPVLSTRGETLQAALAPGSEFRRIVEGIDPEQTAVTFWVYPDSFALFRQLRDLLYERDIVVAGRPLPEGVPIASSRRGTVSRGQ